MSEQLAKLLNDFAYDVSWHRDEPAAKSKQAILDFFSEAVTSERARCVACLPTNWCDGLLSGPAAVIDAPPWNCPDIEAVIAGIKERMENPK